MGTFSTKHSAIVALASLLGIGAGAALTAARNPEAVLDPGGELRAVLPDAVMSITYRTLSGTMAAQRSREGAPFAVQATFANGRPIEQCVARADLAGALDAVTEFVVKRGLSFKEREQRFPLQLGVLDIQTLGIAEPDDPILVFTDSTRSSVAVIMNGVAAEVTLPVSAFAKLEQGCAALAAR